MKRLTLDDLQLSVRKFEADQILNTEVIWLDKAAFLGNDSISVNEAEANDAFLKKFSFAIKKNEFSDEMVFCDENKKKFIAERYGGGNIGTNGGGARCGNIGDYQVKGIGKTPVAAISTADHWHTYGFLNLIDATYELILSKVLDKILPAGTVKIYGVILTGSHTAVLPGSDELPMCDRLGAGALLIRDACLRPAHFLRSPAFDQLNGTDVNKQLSDVSRVRAICKKYFSLFGSPKNILHEIYEILDIHARQFSFAQTAKIFHGSLSASNLGLDGKWIDLSNTTFLDSNTNLTSLSSFYDEPDIAINIFEEVIHTVSKYNSIGINFTPLKNFYYDRIDYYYSHSISYIFGFDSLIKKEDYSSPEFRHLLNCYKRNFLKKGSQKFGRCFNFSHDDPLLNLLRNCVSVVNGERNFDIIYHETSQAFIAFIKYLHAKRRNESNYTDFFCAVMCIALKRNYLSEFFFLGSLENKIYTLVKSKQIEELKRLIKQSTELGDWAFNLDELKELNNNDYCKMHDISIIIFRCSQLTVHYQPLNRVYKIYDHLNTRTVTLQSFHIVKESIKIFDSVFHFTYKNYFDALDHLFTSV